MNIALDSRFLRLVGKALLYLVGAVILGFGALRFLGEDSAKILAYVLALAALFGFEEGFRRGSLRADASNSQSREFFWWSYGVAIWAATILLA